MNVGDSITSSTCAESIDSGTLATGMKAKGDDVLGQWYSICNHRSQSNGLDRLAAFVYVVSGLHYDLALDHAGLKKNKE